jgi:PTH1 family peptidyl-tRNA hydrolase
MKYLIVGLGNIGVEYAQTRHNIGFDIAEALVKKHLGNFTVQKHAQYAQVSLRGRQMHVIMPTTYMNLSGKAVRHWMTDLNIPIENIFIFYKKRSSFFKKYLKTIQSNGSRIGFYLTEIGIYG